MGNTTENSGTENSNENEIVENKNNKNSTNEDNVDDQKNKDDEKLFTQKELDEKLKARLDREKEKFSQLQNEFNTFKENVGDVDSLKKTFDEVKLEKEELLANNDKLSNDFLKYKIAFEKGLSLDGLGLLSGKDEEELVENADRIMRLAGTRQTLPSKNYDGANAGSSKKSIYSEVQI